MDKTDAYTGTLARFVVQYNPFEDCTIRDISFRHLSEIYRILFRDIVQCVVTAHTLDKCYKPFTTESIIIINGVGFVDSEINIQKSDEGVRNDYICLSKIIKSILTKTADDISTLPYDIYSLLYTLDLPDVHEHEYYILRHFAILSTTRRVLFMEKLMNYRTVMDLGRQIVLEEAIKLHDNMFRTCGIQVEDWRIHIKKVPLLKELYENKYGANLFNTTKDLLIFIRNVINHLGNHDRWALKTSPYHLKDADVYFSGLFPFLITILQFHIYEQKLLDYFALHDHDRRPEEGPRYN